MIELKHIQVFYYKTKELKEKFYINNSSTNSREFYQALYKWNDLTRNIEYIRYKDKSMFKEIYTNE